MAAVLVAVVAALTVLPAILLLLGRRIDAGRLPWRRHRPVTVDNDHGALARLAHAVMRHPVVVMVVVVGALLVVASPFLGVKWGSVDYRVLPPDSPAHVAAAKLNTEFGPETSTANMMLPTTDQAEVAAYTQKVEQVPGVVDVRPVAQTKARRTATPCCARRGPATARPRPRRRPSGRSVPSPVPAVSTSSSAAWPPTPSTCSPR